MLGLSLSEIGAVITALGIILLWYVYDGYGRLLSLLDRRSSPKISSLTNTSSVSVSVIVPAFNEEENIRVKLDDLLNQDYPQLLEILVVSDGSTDATDDIVREYRDKRVKLLHTKGREGKSQAQNIAVGQAIGDVLVLTDVAVRMGCIAALVEPFAKPEVGCSTAHLTFADDDSADTGEAVSHYWRYELLLRRLETRLGWLATASGPAMAIRRSLWQNLEPQYGDDCVLPLDVVLQGYKVVQVEAAKAVDVHFSDFRREFRARIRMTVRNWTGTMSRGALLNPCKYPSYAVALWSHKMLRWLSPVYLLLILLGLVLLVLGDGSWVPLIGYVILVGYGVLGIFAMARGKDLPMSSTIASFLLANAGFAVGLFQVARGRLIRIYDNAQA